MAKHKAKQVRKPQLKMSPKPGAAPAPIARVNGRFAPGVCGNPQGGRLHHGSGRTQALRILDKVCKRSRNKEALFRALQTEFLDDPVRFFKTLVMPLLPKESLVKLEQASKVPVRLTDAAPGAESEPSPKT
jgi:hypothetical protein